jgi:hypothetical protein
VVGDIAAQLVLVLERAGRRAGVALRRDVHDTAGSARLRYRFDIDDVPVDDELRHVTVEIPGHHGLAASVFIDGPACLRHRYVDGSLCLWYVHDPPAAKWLVSDGLLALIELIRDHAFCEARCRDGADWLKPESRGDHPPTTPLHQMPSIDTETLAIAATIAGTLITVSGALTALWANGERTERQRRRELHARALAAVLAYLSRRCHSESR